MRRVLPALAISLLASHALPAQQKRVDYEIAFPNAAQHEARVTATFRGLPAGRTLHARMSRSSPGRYALHEFAKNVYDVSAVDGRGRPLVLTRPDPYGWNAAGHDGTVRISYTVWGDRTDGTYLSVDHSHAHMNMPATFMWARELVTAPIRLVIRPQPGWRVATQLVAASGDSLTFTAPDLQYFMDSPTEVGPITMRSWSETIGGRRSTWRLAVHHTGTEAQVDTFARMARAVVAEQNAMWSEPPRFDHGVYTFIADYLPWASGDGMEHRNSTILSNRGALADSASRASMLGTLSHEYIHAWNVERLRPRSLEPFDFERANMSPDLWFAEGFTTYLGPLAIRRAGLSSDAQFLASMGSAVTTVLDAPGRRHFSAAEMSMQAPFVDAGTSIDPVNRVNTFISYYTWGHAIGLALDLTLRQRFKVTLDDYLRALWRDFGRHQTAALAPALPYTAADLRTTLGRVTGSPAFANEFFARYIEGREAADYAALLSQAGFLLATDGLRPWLGASLADDTSRVFVNWAGEGGSAYSAGISSGDFIYAIGNERTTSIDALNAILGRRRVGETVQVEVQQRGVRRSIPMTIRGNTPRRFVTYESAGRPITAEIRAFRESWLGSKVSGASRKEVDRRVLDRG